MYFKSPRIKDSGQAFYDLLRSCQTWETAGISSELHLTMDGEVFKVKTEHSDVHINEAADFLKIYIPHNEVAQDVCIQHALPRKLVEWMMTAPGNSSDKKAVSVDDRAAGIVKGLLNARIQSVAEILDREGIIEVGIPNLDLESDEGASSPKKIGMPLGPYLPGPSLESHTGGESSDFHGFDSTDTTLHLQLRQRQQVPYDYREVSVEKYNSFLSYIIAAARAISFPSSHGGNLDLPNLFHNLVQLSGDKPWPKFDKSLFNRVAKQDRDVKVGAAGELYVSN